MIIFDNDGKDAIVGINGGPEPTGASTVAGHGTDVGLYMNTLLNVDIF